jgi:hypothetical protein
MRQPRSSRDLWEENNPPSQILPVHWEAASWPPYLPSLAHLSPISRNVARILPGPRVQLFFRFVALRAHDVNNPLFAIDTHEMPGRLKIFLLSIDANI